VSVAFVRGFAQWTAEDGAPQAMLLPTQQRRRCSLLTRMVAHVTAELIDDGLVLDDAALVIGTGFGEISTTVELMAMMHAEPGELSPIRFAGSVHNAAAGQLAIAVGHRGRQTTISAGTRTLAAAWLEALGLLGAGVGQVLVVLADEPLPAPLHPRHDALAVALWLSASPERARARVQWLGDRRDPPPWPRTPAMLQHNPVVPAWCLGVAIADAHASTVRLEPDDVRGHAACVRVEPLP
jgi:hypothetical protein